MRDHIMNKQSKRELWNKCDKCGRIIPYADIGDGTALHRMDTPESAVSYEKFTTLCRHHYKPNPKHEGLS